MKYLLAFALLGTVNPDAHLALITKAEIADYTAVNDIRRCIKHNETKVEIQKCADRVVDDLQIKLQFIMDDLLKEADETAKEVK